MLDLFITHATHRIAYAYEIHRIRTQK